MYMRIYVITEQNFILRGLGNDLDVYISGLYCIMMNSPVWQIRLSTLLREWMTLSPRERRGRVRGPRVLSSLMWRMSARKGEGYSITAQISAH